VKVLTIKGTIEQNTYSVQNFEKNIHLLRCDPQFPPVCLVEFLWNILSLVSAKFHVIFSGTALWKFFGNFLGSVSTKLPRDILGSVSVKFSRNLQRCVPANLIEIRRTCLSQISRNFLGCISSTILSEFYSSVTWRNSPGLGLGECSLNFSDMSQFSRVCLLGFSQNFNHMHLIEM
jgi:hypothetical protein